MSDNVPQKNNNTGIPIPEDAFIVIVRTEWNAATVDLLENGCKSELDQQKILHKTIIVPGAFEIPFAVKKYWDSRKSETEKPVAFIALGCVLRGDTPHFDYVCKAVTDGIMHLNLHLPVPVVFGVLTVDDQHQADDRTGGKHGNKGAEAASTAITMVMLSMAMTAV